MLVYQCVFNCSECVHVYAFFHVCVSNLFSGLVAQPVP